MVYAVQYWSYVVVVSFWFSSFLSRGPCAMGDLELRVEPRSCIDWRKGFPESSGRL